ncbi:MAG: DUF2520 domain-containing protein [Acidimicrobiales bacterium]
MQSVRFIGRGRAGGALALALAGLGWDVRRPLGRGDDPSDAAAGVDLLVIATPDDVVAEVASAVHPVEGTVVLHLAGSLGTDVLAPHRRRAALHPLVPLPDPSAGAQRLTGGVTFAVAGDRLAAAIAGQLGGRVVEVADADRPAYHAAACIAANHVVALLGQAERVAASAGLGLEAFLDLARAAVDDVARLGPAAALTGPASRGDWATLAAHRDALDPSERPGYHAGAALARRLAEQGTAPAAGRRPGGAVARPPGPDGAVAAAGPEGAAPRPDDAAPSAPGVVAVAAR